MKTGLISVIVPIYNAEAYLEKTVSSILAQSYKNIEVILVNDGSKDKSGDICDTFAKKDSRVKAIHKKNCGESSARNVGIDAAEGEFIALVDHDDIPDTDMYEQMHKKITHSCAEICICGYKQEFDGYKRIIRVPQEEKMSKTHFFEAYLNDFESYNRIFPMPWNKLYLADVIKKRGYNEISQTIQFPQWLSVGGDLWFNADVMDRLTNDENAIAFADIMPYNFLAANNPSSGGKSDIVENSCKAFAHLAKVMLSVLPHRSRQIEEMYETQKCLYITNELHKAAIFKRKTGVRLKWNTVSTITKSHVSFSEKASAVLLFFAPKPIYRIAFKLYSKTALK